LLDESAAKTPVTDAAVAHAATLDAESLTDFSTLHHGVNPTTAGNTLDGGENKSIAVAGIGSLHCRVSHTVGSFTQHYNEDCQSCDYAKIS
jgi:hypothetical protein